MLTNPLQNGFLIPLAIMLGAVFSSFGLLLLGLQWVRRPVLIGGVTVNNAKYSTALAVLWQRYRTWAIIALLLGGAVLSGALPLALVCTFLVWQGGREYATLTKLPVLHCNLLILAGWLTLAGTLLYGATALMIAPIVMFFGASLLALAPIKGEGEVGERFAPLLTGLFGYLYIGWLPAHLVALELNRGAGLVMAVALGVALSDVGAFCTGKTFGGAKLAPRLSPNKTWGGVVGNFGGAALALVLVSFGLPVLAGWQIGLLVLIIGFGSIWGDLLESLLKRQSRVKDAGGLLPGFGGLLDRVDSLLLVAPLVYYVTLLF